MSTINSQQTRLNIRELLFQECRSMVEYAFANGLPVPIEVAKTIDELNPTASTPKELDEISEQPNPNLDSLVIAHQTLSALVKPALPRTILLLETEHRSNHFWNFLGPVPIIRQMMIASLMSLLLFVAFAYSADVTVGAGNILSTHGMPLLKNLCFYLAAAGLGASFAALYKANSYITKGTFNPTYHASYWIRFSLGIISGLVLSVMVSESALNTPTEIPAIPSTDLIDHQFLRPMLAMLGGFSADLLYTILSRLVETVESLFRGSAKNLLAMQQQEADTQLATNKA